MKKSIEHRVNDRMKPEYDFASMMGGVRGKHSKEYRQGTNIVVLERDVAEAFPTENAVNEALRGILKTTQAVRRIGGLPDRTLSPRAAGSKRHSSGK